MKICFYGVLEIFIEIGFGHIVMEIWRYRPWRFFIETSVMEIVMETFIGVMKIFQGRHGNYTKFFLGETIIFYLKTQKRDIFFNII
jgi:hypothetical protein